MNYNIKQTMKCRMTKNIKQKNAIIGATTYDQ